MAPPSFRLDTLAVNLIERLEPVRRAHLDDPARARAALERTTAQVAANGAVHTPDAGTRTTADRHPHTRHTRPAADEKTKNTGHDDDRQTQTTTDTPPRKRDDDRPADAPTGRPTQTRQQDDTGANAGGGGGPPCQPLTVSNELTSCRNAPRSIRNTPFPFPSSVKKRCMRSSHRSRSLPRSMRSRAGGTAVTARCRRARPRSPRRRAGSSRPIPRCASN